jgi:hypothetical protein
MSTYAIKYRSLLITCLLAAVTSVAQTNPATLQISGTGANVNIQWNNAGTLQSAPSVGGPWSTYSGGVAVSSSAVTPVSGSNLFFRVVNNGVAGQPVPLLPTTLTSPLQVESASIQLLPAPVAGGNTLLVLTVAPGPGSPSSSNVITLLIDNALTLLRDDGQFPDVTANDGNFSAVINVNPSDIDSWNAEFSNLPANGQVSYVFSGRSIVATNSMQPFPKTNFLAGQAVVLVDNTVPSSVVKNVGPCNGSPNAYDAYKTEMILDLSVVADPARTWDNNGPPSPGGVGGVGTQMGPWSFGLLISNIANTAVTGITPSDFVLRWLQSYQFAQTINGDTVQAVSAVQSQIVSPWQTATAAEGGFPPGAVDVAIAPFRLLAIVNRVDLRDNSTYGGPEPAGEARFVFENLGQFSTNETPSPFTVILEYAVPLHGCDQVQAWGAQWAALNALPLPSAAFNNALQAITDQFSKAGQNSAQLPNMSAIAQIRANDDLGPQLWESREFNLDSSGFLVETAVKATPADRYNNTTDLLAFINSVPAPGKYCTLPPLTAAPSISIPVIFNGKPFLGGYAPSEGEPGMFWTPPYLSVSTCCVRHILSLNTCNGCHSRETGNGAAANGFTHVKPRNFGVQSSLSGFLTGTSVLDPSGCTSDIYNYSDLARRVQDLNSLVTCGCKFEVSHIALKMPH